MTGQYVINGRVDGRSNRLDLMRCSESDADHSGGLPPLLGGAGRVSEVLNGKINLRMSMVRRLRERFGISADLLIPSGSGRRAAA